jgi:hypothetical protein
MTDRAHTVASALLRAIRDAFAEQIQPVIEEILREEFHELETDVRREMQDRQ